MRATVPSAGLAVLLLAMPPAAAASRSHIVLIDAMKFGAMPTGIRAGDRISWVNKDMFRHTATARDKSFDIDLPPGAGKTMLAGKAGTVMVICRYHPGMRATLKVAAR